MSAQHHPFSLARKVIRCSCLCMACTGADQLPEGTRQGNTMLFGVCFCALRLSKNSDCGGLVGKKKSWCCPFAVGDYFALLRHPELSDGA